MILVPRLQTLMVCADGDGMQGYVAGPLPESHDNGIHLLLSGCPRPPLAFRQDSAPEGDWHVPPIGKHLLDQQVQNPRYARDSETVLCFSQCSIAATVPGMGFH